VELLLRDSLLTEGRYLSGVFRLVFLLLLAGVNEGDAVIIGPYKALENIKDDEDYIDENIAIKKTVDKPAMKDAQAKKNGRGGA